MSVSEKGFSRRIIIQSLKCFAIILEICNQFILIKPEKKIILETVRRNIEWDSVYNSTGKYCLNYVLYLRTKCCFFKSVKSRGKNSNSARVQQINFHIVHIEVNI